MNNRCKKECYIGSLLINLVRLESIGQFRLVKDAISNRVIDVLINKTAFVNLFDNLLTFCDSYKKFNLKGDLFKMITN